VQSLVRNIGNVSLFVSGSTLITFMVCCEEINNSCVTLLPWMEIISLPVTSGEGYGPEGT